MLVRVPDLAIGAGSAERASSKAGSPGRLSDCNYGHVVDASASEVKASSQRSSTRSSPHRNVSTVTRNGRPVAVALSTVTWRPSRDLAILSDPAVMREIQQGRGAIASGDVVTKDDIEARRSQLRSKTACRNALGPGRCRPARRAIDRLRRRSPSRSWTTSSVPDREPTGVGKPLRGDLIGLHSARVGAYRIVYEIYEAARKFESLHRPPGRRLPIR